MFLVAWLFWWFSKCTQPTTTTRYTQWNPQGSWFFLAFDLETLIAPVFAQWLIDVVVECGWPTFINPVELIMVLALYWHLLCPLIIPIVMPYTPTLKEIFGPKNSHLPALGSRSRRCLGFHTQIFSQICWGEIALFEKSVFLPYKIRLPKLQK